MISVHLVVLGNYVFQQSMHQLALFGIPSLYFSMHSNPCWPGCMHLLHTTFFVHVEAWCPCDKDGAFFLSLMVDTSLIYLSCSTGHGTCGPLLPALSKSIANLWLFSHVEVPGPRGSPRAHVSSFHIFPFYKFKNFTRRKVARRKNKGKKFDKKFFVQVWNHTYVLEIFISRSTLDFTNLFQAVAHIPKQSFSIFLDEICQAAHITPSQIWLSAPHFLQWRKNNNEKQERLFNTSSVKSN